MVEKAGDNTNETPKPSKLRHLFRFGWNSGTKNSASKIGKGDIGPPKLISLTSFLPDHQISSPQPNTVTTGSLISDSGATEAGGPDIHKPLPPLPREMMAEPNITGSAGGPIKSDLVSQAGNAQRLHKPGSRLSIVDEDPEPIADTPPTNSHSFNAGSPTGIRKLSSLETIGEKPDYGADGDGPADRAVASAENQADNSKPRAARSSLQSFLKGAGSPNPPGRRGLQSFLASARGPHNGDKGQVSTDNLVVSAENETGDPTSKPSRNTQQSFIANRDAGEGGQRPTNEQPSRGFDTRQRDNGRG